MILTDAAGRPLAGDVRQAKGFAGRLLGLMGRRVMPGDGLLFEPAGSIHTFFMRMAIDILFLDRDGRLLKLCPAVPPWRIRPAPRAARRVLEMPAGWAARAGVRPGDRLALLESPSGGGRRLGSR